MKIWFAHAVNIENSGDGASTPYNYFKEYFDQYECARINVTRLEEYDLKMFSKADVAIIGGGGILDLCTTWNTNIENLISRVGRSVVWGAGYSFSELSRSASHINLSGCNCIGIRDYYSGEGAEPTKNYVPCVSCLHPEFDAPHKVKRNVGFMLHYYWKTRPQNGEEFILNNAPFEEIIKFICESSIVVSNSYHGCYIGWLAGKPVFRIVEVEGDSRFTFSKQSYNIFNGKIPTGVNFGDSTRGDLIESRNINLKFFEKVKEVIEDEL